MDEIKSRRETLAEGLNKKSIYKALQAALYTDSFYVLIIISLQPFLGC